MYILFHFIYPLPKLIPVYFFPASLFVCVHLCVRQMTNNIP